MEIMRRYEGRLARLEEFVRWWLDEQELKRTRPERMKKWAAWVERNMPWLCAQSPPSPSTAAVPANRTVGAGAANVRRPLTPSSAMPLSPPEAAKRQDADTSDPGSGRQGTEPGELRPAPPPPPPPPPPAPFLSPPPPPRPAIEFIERGGGMSIAIDTATGQMATSAQVMAALAQMPKRSEES